MELHFLEFNKWRPIHASVGSVSGVPAWMTWVVRQRKWSGWCTSVGVMDGVLKWVPLMISEEIPRWWARQYLGWRTISETVSKNSQGMNIAWSWKKNSRFRLYTLPTFFRVSPGYWNLEVILKLFPEQIQNSDIFRNRAILRILSICLVKMQHFKITETFKNIGIFRTWDIFRIPWISGIQFT